MADYRKHKDQEQKRVQKQPKQSNSGHKSKTSTYAEEIERYRRENTSLKAQLKRVHESEGQCQQRNRQLEHDLAMARQDLQRYKEVVRQQGIAIASLQQDHTPGEHNAEESAFPQSRTSSSKGKTVKVAEVREMEKQWRADMQKKDSELKRLTGKLLDDTHKPGGDAANRYTHSGLVTEYDKLYTTKKQSTKRALEHTGIQHQAIFDEILNQIFPVAYDECKAVVLQMLFRDLFRPHKDGEDTKSAGQQARIYGQLLQLSPNLPLPLTAILDKFNKGNIRSLRRKAKEQSISEVEDYLKESVELAWKMVTISPPMIADWPAEFDEDLHEKAFEEWSEASESFDLVYRRPVLYNSYRDSMPASKARVGNKYKEPRITTTETESEV